MRLAAIGRDLEPGRMEFLVETTRRLNEFIEQEECRGVPPADLAELDEALAAIIKQPRSEDRTSRSVSREGQDDRLVFRAHQGDCVLEERLHSRTEMGRRLTTGGL